MTDNIERLRSLFMAALMVFSVVALSTAMAGTAAAGVDTAERTVSDSSVSPGGEVTVTTTVNTDGDSTETLTISEEILPAAQSASIDSIEVDGSDASTGLEIEGGDGILVTINDVPANSEVVLTYTVTTEDIENAEYEITGTASGSGTEADIGSATIETTAADDGGEDDDNDDEPVDSEDAPLNSGSTFYTGQEVVVNGLDANADYTVNPVDDNEVESLRQALSSDADGTADFELSSGLSDGEFVLVDNDGDVVRVDDGTAVETLDPTSESNVQSASFDVVSQDLDATFDESSVGNDGGDTTVEYEIESNVRNNYVVNVSAQGDLDTEELQDIFGGDADVVATFEDDDIIRITQSGSNSAEGTYDLDFDDINADTYTFEANVTDADASDADDIDVTDTGDASADFSDSLYTNQRGDLVNITVEMSNTDVATLQIGDIDESGYSVVTEVEDDDEDGVAYVEFNSFAAGNGNPSAAVMAGDDDTELSDITSPDGSFDGNQPAGTEILDAGQYNMYAVEGEKTSATVGSSDADSRATLDLNAASLNGLQIWTSPAEELGDLRDEDVEDLPARIEAGNLTETGSVAQGDAVVVQVDGSGLEGALELGPATEVYNTTSENADIFSLSFEEDAALNQDDAVVNVSDIGEANYDVLYDGANDAHYVVIDSNALTDEFNHEDGDEYTANFTVFEDGTDLLDDSASATQEFSVDDPELDLDVNDNDTLLLGAGPGQEITGDTNLAPGSEVEVSLDSDDSSDPFIKRPDGTVNMDGTFTIVADFEGNEAGTNFTAQAVVNDVESDEYDGQHVDRGAFSETLALGINCQQGDAHVIEDGHGATGQENRGRELDETERCLHVSIRVVVRDGGKPTTEHRHRHSG